MHEFKKINLAFALVLSLLLYNQSAFAQVCPMVTSSSSNPDCSVGCNVCPGDNITFSVTGDDLPDGGTIDWYSGSTPGFNPYQGQGTLVGSSAITTAAPAPCTDCPEILAIMVDACATPEGANEFMIISSGSGFTVSDLSLDFAAQNNSGGPASDDINVGATCNWQAGNPSLISGCSNVIPAGPGTFIPAGSTVVIQTSSSGNFTYDFSATCGMVDCIYVIANTCNRASFGGFTNCDGNGLRDYTIFLNSCVCTSTATYSTDDPAIDCPGGAGPTADGTYYINGGGFGNDGCPNAPPVAASPGASNPSSIADFVYTPTTADCTGAPVYIVGISNPAPSNCCADVFTDYFALNVSCPMANPGVGITACDIGNGTANFDLTSVTNMISGGSGSVNWYTDAGATMPITNTTNYNSGNGTVYATVLLGCESLAEAVTLTVETGPVATAGAPQVICGGQPVSLSGSISPSVAGGVWTTSGDGSFVNMNSPVTTYTPGTADINTGSVTLTLTANPGANCPGTASSLVLTINPPATVNAGGPYNICSGQTVPLMGVIGGSGVSGTWSSLGDGTFDNPNNANAIYTPGIGDVGLGTVNLQFTVSSSFASCPPVNDMAVINIAQGPSGTIQGNTNICASVAANLSVITSGPAGNVIWSTNGDGSFSSGGNVVTDYTPGPGDAALGFVTITVTISSTNGCPAATDDVILNINAGEMVSATVPSSVCGSEDILLQLNTSGPLATVLWSSATGDGVFGNPTNTATNYTPGPGDILNGNVQIQVIGLNPPCTNYQDNFTIDITPTPAFVLSANPTTLCGPGTINLTAVADNINTGGIFWSSNGDGVFDQLNILTPTYTVGTNDVSNGTVTLYAQASSVDVNCPSGLDSLVINIGSAPMAMINGNPAGCDGDDIVLDVTIGNGATTVTWSTSGDGSFDDINSLTPVYTPGSNDQTNGTVTIIVTTDSPNANCPAATDMVVVTIESSPTISLSGTAMACGQEIINISSSASANAGTISWSTSGDGSFSATTGTNTDYTIGSSDVSNGQVTIYGTTADPAGPCTEAIDSLVITVETPVSAGTANPTTILCEDANTVIDLFGELNTADAGGTWTEISTTPSSGSGFNAGAGTFNVSGQLPNTYEFQYLLMGVAPCQSDSTVVTVEIIASPSATVTNAGIICNASAQGSIFDFDALVTAGDMGGSWVDTDGTAVDLTNSAAVDFNGVAPGNYTFTYTTNSATAPCNEVDYTAVITVENCVCPSPATNPLPDLCDDAANIDLSTYVVTTESGSWAITSTPAGTNPATLSGNQFMGNGSDAGIYTLTFTLDAAPLASCPDSSVQTILLNPAVNAGTALGLLEICNDQGQNINLFDRITGEDGGGSWTETSATPSTGGAFDPSGSFNTTGQNAGTYTFEYFLDGVLPCTDDRTTVSISLINPPSATVTNAGVICNETAQGSIFNFDALVTAGDMGGSWADTDGTAVNLTNSAAVDFDGITPGNYTFTYTTNSATAPCNEVEYTAVITVENCVCPSPATNPLPDLCDDAGNLDLSTFVATSESGSWAITSTPAGTNPATLSGNQFIGNGSDAGMYTLTFTLDAAPLASCPDSSVQTLQLNPAVNAGTALGLLEICNDQGQNINLFDRVNGEDGGGSWTETSATPSTGGAFDPSGSFNTTGQNAGTYTFEYFVDGLLPCNDDRTTVSISLINPPTATVAAGGVICNETAQGSIFNFDALVTAGDMGGSWADTDGSSVNLSNTTAVDFNGIAPGNYTFTYTTNSATAPCVELSYTTVITVENCACPSPATNPIAPLCVDAANWDLSTAILTTEPGSWAITGTPAGTNPATLSGNQFMGTGSDAGMYILTFTLDAAPLASCPDSSVQTLIINPLPSATVTTADQICNSTVNGSILNFDLLVTAGDQSGSWADSDGAGVNLTNSMAVDFNGVAAGNYTFTYTTNSAIAPCNEVSYTTVITVENCACPSPATNPIAPLCVDAANWDLSTSVITTEPGSWAITGTPAGTNPATLSGNQFIGTGSDPGMYTLTFTLDAAPLASCPDSSVQTLIINPLPSATVTNAGQICNATADGSIFNFDLLVTAGDQSGSWVDSDGAGVNLSNTASVDFNGIAPGNYTFTYTTNSAIAPCNEVSYTAVITVENCVCPSAQTLPLPDLCNNVNGLALNSFVQTSEPGSWAITATPVGSNPGTLIGDFFDGLNSDPGFYTFTFTLDAAPLANCPDSSVQVLELFAPPNSGTSTFSFTACDNETQATDLNQFLFGADPGGIWTETSAVPSTGGAFNPVTATFTPTNQAAGLYTFNYAVPANGACAGTSTTYMVFVEEMASANVMPMAIICNDLTNGSIINFNNLITAGDNSGSWTDTDGTGVNLSNLNSVNFDGIAPGTYTFTYEVGLSSQFCSSTAYTTEITVENCLCPSPNTLAVPNFCENSSVVNLFDYNFPGQMGSWSISNQPGGVTPPVINGGNLLNIGIGDPGIYELTFTLAAAPLAACPDSSVINFEILPTPNVNIDSTLCFGDSIIVNGTVYNAGTPIGTEVFTGLAANGCDSIVNINLDFFPIVMATLDTTICQGQSIVINGMTFNEITPNGEVIFIDGAQNGCDSFLMVTVNFEPIITGSLSADNAVCLGDSVDLDFNFSSGSLFDVTYTLNGNSFNLNGIAANHTETIYLDQNTTITILNANALGISCPVDSPLSPVLVEIIDLQPNAQITTDYNGFAVSCNGSSDAAVQIDIMGGTQPYDFDWAGNAPDLNNLAAGNYSATVSDDNGCVDSLNFNISEPIPTDFTIDTNPVTCPGDFSGSILVDNISGPGTSYSYSLDNVNFTPINSLPFSIDGLGEGSVSLFIEDENNCGVSTTANIPLVNNLLIDPIPDRTIELGDSVQLMTNTNFTIGSISWSPATNLSCSDCLDPIASPSETTLYTVTITDDMGCEIETTVELRVEVARVYIPNVFSPNGDGINDEFYIQSGNNNLVIEQFIIVDRWGEIVFKGTNFAPNNPSLGWDGKLRGENLNPAVFVYYAQIRYPDGRVIPMKGDVTLMR